MAKTAQQPLNDGPKIYNTVRCELVTKALMPKTLGSRSDLKAKYTWTKLQVAFAKFAQQNPGLEFTLAVPAEHRLTDEKLQEGIAAMEQKEQADKDAANK